MARETRDESYYWAAVHREKKMKGVVKDLRDRPEKSLTEETGDNSLKETGQQRLTYFPEKPQTGPENRDMKIIIDSRERCTEIMKTLENMTEIEIQTLPVGDYILSDRVCVERKTVSDFLASLMDKRLFSQAADLSRNFKKPLLFIEGKEDIYSARGISANAIRGAIASLAIDFGISVIYTDDENDTAGFLLALVKGNTKKDDRHPCTGKRSR